MKMNDTVNKNTPENDGGLDCKENLEKNKQDNFYTRKERILQQKKQYLARIKEKRLEKRKIKEKVKYLKARLKANRKLKAELSKTTQQKNKTISRKHINELRGINQKHNRIISKTSINIKNIQRQRDER